MYVALCSLGHAFARMLPALTSAVFAASALGMPATLTTTMFVAPRKTMLPSYVWPLALRRTHPVDPVPMPGEKLCGFPGMFGAARLENTLARSLGIGVYTKYNIVRASGSGLSST